MNTAKRFGLLLDLLLLAASLTTGGPVAEQVRILAILVAAVLGGLVIVCAVILAIAVLDQRKPPYPI
jgi:CHASE2 domain-containing sensor protein